MRESKVRINGAARAGMARSMAASRFCVVEKVDRATRKRCKELTGNYFWALKVFVRMQVARRERKVEPDSDQYEVHPSPHCDEKSGCVCLSACAGLV